MLKFKIGYTTGVYDMFHVGHLNLLNNAKKYCDYLIVGISTDELVFNYKGKTPIIPFDERSKIVSNIKCVDQVIPQINMDKLHIMQKYKCNAIFVGDDWKGTEKWNRFEHDFKKYEIQTIYLPYTKGTSSTILRKILYKELNQNIR